MAFLPIEDNEKAGEEISKEDILLLENVVEHVDTELQRVFCRYSIEYRR